MESFDVSHFKRVLVYQDAARIPGSALSRAVKLARDNSARLTIVDIVSEMPKFMRDFWPTPAGALEGDIAGRNAKLEEVKGSIRDEGIEAETKVLRGRPFVELVRETLNGGHDVLMKDAFAKSSDLFFGSLDQRLLRYCTKPIWLVKPHVPHNCEQVVAAIEPVVDHKGDALNRKIIRLASSVCRRDHGRLSVVSVWHAPFDLLESGEEYRANYDIFKGQIESAARATIDRALKSSFVDVARDRIKCVAGVPNDEIVDYVKGLDADLLVMGTVARTGVAGLLIGNTAEKVLRRVRCSVLAVKPDGFVSPLEAVFDEEEVSPAA